MTVSDHNEVLRMLGQAIDGAKSDIVTLFELARKHENNCSQCRENIMSNINTQNTDMLKRMHQIEIAVKDVTWKVSAIIGVIVLLAKFAPDFIAAVKALPIQ